ncbi:MAG: formylglycine-generating enzyme family protein [Myxococcota bacterium]|nr:formylglycine-generating enzyme family protein [Myxococcota bacterium]
MNTFALALSLMATSWAQEEPKMWPKHDVFVAESQPSSEDVVFIISINDYLYVSDFPGAKPNAKAWKKWFEQSKGIPEDRLFFLENENATRKNIDKTWKKITKTIGKKGRIWFVYLGYGSSHKEQAFIIPSDTSLKKNAARKSGWYWNNIQRYLEKNEEVEVIAFLDACFNGTVPVDENGDQEPLNIKTETLSAQLLASERLTYFLSNSMNACLGEIPRLRQLPFSYLALGALRGWGDIDNDGQITAQEVLGYINKVYTYTAPTRPQDSTLIPESRELVLATAEEEGPDLEEINWILYPKLKEKRGREFLPWDKVGDQSDFDELLADLSKKRKMDLTFEAERSEKSAALREKAERHWGEVEKFVDQAVDDYSRMAAYAFLDNYKSTRVQVQAQKIDIDINQVQEAEKLILGMEIPSLADDSGFEFVWVPSGSFIMGSPLEEVDRDEEERQHPVRISNSFYVSASEVTQELYEKVMNENPSAVSDSVLPVNQITWYDAIRFANRLSLKEGLETCYIINGEQVSWPNGTDCLGYRLPTEAEWEYASRANSPGLYSGGNNIDVVAWYESNSSSQVQPVRTKAPNQWGIYDMSGNVWEWVWDGYGPYPTEEAIDPIGEDISSYRIRRGGSVGHLERYARSAYRVRVNPNFRSYDIGFRIVRTAMLPDLNPSPPARRSIEESGEAKIPSDVNSNQQPQP